MSCIMGIHDVSHCHGSLTYLLQLNTVHLLTHSLNSGDLSPELAQQISTRELSTATHTAGAVGVIWNTGSGRGLAGDGRRAVTTRWWRKGEKER